MSNLYVSSSVSKGVHYSGRRPLRARYQRRLSMFASSAWIGDYLRFKLRQSDITLVIPANAGILAFERMVLLETIRQT